MQVCWFAGAIQVTGWCDAGPDVLIQVLECSDAGPRMVRCRSLDVAIQVLGCANFRNGNSVGERRNTFEKNRCYRLNVWAIIHPLTSFHFWVDPLFKGGVLNKIFENKLCRNIHVICNYCGAYHSPPQPPLPWYRIQGIIIVIKGDMTSHTLTWFRNMCTVPYLSIMIT